MSTLDFAKSELDIIGMTEDSPDEMNQMMRKHILHMVNEFAEEGHSGMSASYAIGILEKVLRFKPLTALTGEDSEWTELDYDDIIMKYQNKRCARVFKDVHGQAYDSGGIVFWNWYTDEDGKQRKSHFTSRDSRVNITFPYTPIIKYQEADPNHE